MADTAAPPHVAAWERALRHDRVVVSVALGVVFVTSWFYLLSGAGMDDPALASAGMSQTDPDALAGLSGPAKWTPAHALVMFAMWWVMMVAMMLPSAAPMILLFAAVNRKQRSRGVAHVPTMLFAGAYLGVWGMFSLAATLAQWGLQEVGWLSSMLVSRSTQFGGVLLLLAGIYQFTPLKQTCLRHCRSPLQFLTHQWRRGYGGALRMGVIHGTYCVGCCWLLMGLLFVGGVMSIGWILGLTLFVLAEKTIPAGHWLGRATGVVLLVGGIWMLVTGLA